MNEIIDPLCRVVKDDMLSYLEKCDIEKFGEIYSSNDLLKDLVHNKDSGSLIIYSDELYVRVSRSKLRPLLEDERSYLQKNLLFYRIKKFFCLFKFFLNSNTNKISWNIHNEDLLESTFNFKSKGYFAIDDSFKTKSL